MLEYYYTVKENGSAEIEIKKSKFICSLARVLSEEDAKEFIQKVKKENWKANHNCSAFIITANETILRSNDDGEPSGTAGVPMLEVLKQNQLSNLVAVVTRYFGGTKLGTGGLVRAYSHSVSNALQKIGIVKGKLQQVIDIEIQYPLLNKVENFLSQSEYTVEKISYTDKVSITCAVDDQSTLTFREDIINLTNDQCSFIVGEKKYVETLVTT